MIFIELYIFIIHAKENIGYHYTQSARKKLYWLFFLEVISNLQPHALKRTFCHIWSASFYDYDFYTNLELIYLLVILIHFKIYFIPVMTKLNFQYHYSSLQCKMILQKSF